MKNLTGWRAVGVAFVAGALAALAMPPLQWLPLAVLGMVVFVWQWDTASGPRSALWRGWAWGLGHFAVGSYWILDAFFVPPADFAFAGPPIVIGLAAILGFFPGLAGMAAKWAALRWPRLGGRHCRLLLLAIGVKLSSPGPAIFKQRRNGLDGEEIVVYKFRSMRTQDNGPVVQQATKDDPRITPFGAFLRKSSLDELPQFINVLQGRMSIVGPRPHAVAHNETYRKLIKGYMIRHKVKPGITGWAQVNGLRGETDTVDKMARRVEYDLEYLRNWSLGLDLHIILRTVLVVFKDNAAY